jgi:hypothetical protein
MRNEPEGGLLAGSRKSGVQHSGGCTTDTVTRAPGIDVERHYYTFGISDALFATILTGPLAVAVIRETATQPRTSTAGADA